MDCAAETNGRLEACDTPPYRRHLGGLAHMPSKAMVLLIRLYQKTISPWLGQRCRFHPSCSNYCIEALQQHGMVFGLWLGLKRICKCHPLHPGGHDPVPERKNQLRKENTHE